MTDPEKVQGSKLPASSSSVSRASAPWVVYAANKQAGWAMPLGFCIILLGVFFLQKSLLQQHEAYLIRRGETSTLWLELTSSRTSILIGASLKLSGHLESIPNQEESTSSGTAPVVLRKPGLPSTEDAQSGKTGDTTIEENAKKAAAESAGSSRSMPMSPVPPSCDIFHGQWTKDTTSYPLYTNDSCKIISEHQNCQGNGRPDSGYEQWRWKPNECDLPAFNAKEFLKTMHGKRILFVGDSVSRNHMESLVCLLNQAEEHVFKGNKHKLNYLFRSEAVMVSRVWSSWLVEEEVGSIPSVDKANVTLLHLDRVGQFWLEDALQADVVVMSSGHWFVKPTVYMVKGKPVGVQMLRNNDSSLSMGNVEAFQMAMRTVLTGLRDNPRFKGVLLFRTYTPDHYEGGKWDTGGSCAGKTEPKKADYKWRNEFGQAMYKHQVDEFAHAFESLSQEQAKRFVFYDIMPMSESRVDGHPGPYRGKQSLETMEKMKNTKFPPPQDCLHWCLPGPVDTWSELILPLVSRALT